MKSKYISLVLVVFVGCSTSKAKGPSVIRENPGQFKVSVSTGGQSLSDLNQKYIQYVSLSRTELTALVGKGSGPDFLPFDGIVVTDSRGQPMGFQIVEVRDVERLRKLGLTEGDLVTAVGRHQTSDTEDLVLFLRALRRDQRGSLTLIRDGQPHKVLYLLEDKPEK